MLRVIAGCAVMAGFCMAGCSNGPTREEFSANEAKCLRCYCGSNALTAEAALVDLERYTRRCQRAGIKGIQYEEVFARIYGRLYVLERRLGHSEMAERYLEKYAHFHAVRSTLARQLGLPHGEMVSLIEHKFDDGLRPAWKNQ